jgi:type II secretory ATPase GspE/PulE/Tfp pilus assembly ATPase PilB-like protein
MLKLSSLRPAPAPARPPAPLGSVPAANASLARPPANVAVLPNEPRSPGFVAVDSKPVVISAGQEATNSADIQEKALREVGVPENHIRIARQRQALTHESLADIMRSAEYGFLSPEGVARVQSLIAGYAYFKPSDIDDVPAGEITAALKKRGVTITKMEGMLPVALLPNGSLRLAISEPLAASKAMLFYPHWKHEFVICSERSLQTIYRRAYAQSAKDALDLYLRIKAVKQDDEGGDQLLREFLLSLMRHGCYLGASDIAFMPMTSDSGGVVRYKVGGEGIVFTFLEAQIWRRVIMGLMTSSGAQEKIKAGPVEVRFEFKEGDLEKFGEIANRYGFRVEMLQRKRTETYAVTVVMRILDQQSESTDLAALNFDEETLRYMREAKDRSTGLFLITGPTGSGKTTTLYSLLNEIDPVSRWIESIENPIEYSKGLWAQFQTDTGGDEAAGAYGLLKGLLRAAPDVILFGEVRKGDIGHELVDAGNTGHLVFSTMHNNSAALAISRLRSFGLDMTAVANLLLGILAQRLMRTLCRCAVVDERVDTLTTLLNIDFLNRGHAQPKPRRAMGCVECGFTGYKGRRMVYELLKTNGRVRDLIEANGPISAISREGINPEFTIMANALRLVYAGITSIEEAKKLGPVEEVS